MMNNIEDFRVKKVEGKLKKLETLLEDGLEKTTLAIREAKTIGKEIKNFKLKNRKPPANKIDLSGMQKRKI